MQFNICFYIIAIVKSLLRVFSIILISRISIFKFDLNLVKNI